MNNKRQFFVIASVHVFLFSGNFSDDKWQIGQARVTANRVDISFTLLIIGTIFLSTFSFLFFQFCFQYTNHLDITLSTCPCRFRSLQRRAPRWEVLLQSTILSSRPVSKASLAVPPCQKWWEIFLPEYLFVKSFSFKYSLSFLINFLLNCLF